MRRILLYTHFNHHHRLSDYVLYQIAKLSPLFDKILFISNSQINQADLEKITRISPMIEFIQRENQGYDFSAWREGIDKLGWDKLREFDSLTLMNDTCYGPLFDLEKIYEKFEQQQVDFWGITSHPKARLSRKIKVAEHLQSYFMVFHSSVLASSIFEEFWLSIKPLSEVQEVILSYETKLTQVLQSEHFSFDSLMSITDELNPSMERPDLILQQKIPFLKVKAFNHRSDLSYYLLEAIKAESDYPLDLVVSHLSERYFPPVSGVLPYLMLSKKDEKNNSLCLHLHLYSLSGFEEIFSCLKNIQLDKLLITFSDESYGKIIMQKISSLKVKQKRNCVHFSKDAWQSLLGNQDFFYEGDHIVHLHNQYWHVTDLKGKYQCANMVKTMLITSFVYPNKDYGLILPLSSLMNDKFAMSKSGFIIQKKHLPLLSDSQSSENLALDLWKRGYTSYYIGQIDQIIFEQLDVKTNQNENKIYSYKEILTYFIKGFGLVKDYFGRLLDEK